MPKYLHTMIRVTDLDATIRFFELLGLREVGRKGSEKGASRLCFSPRRAMRTPKSN